MYCSEPIFITDTVAYCPAVLVSLLLLTTVTPVPAEIVTWPVPFWTSRQLNPSPRPVSIVTMIESLLFNVNTLPLSAATIVYVVPVWSLRLAPKPEIVPEPLRLPLTTVLLDWPAQIVKSISTSAFPSWIISTAVKVQ